MNPIVISPNALRTNQLRPALVNRQLRFQADTAFTTIQGLSAEEIAFQRKAIAAYFAREEHFKAIRNPDSPVHMQMGPAGLDVPGPVAHQLSYIDTTTNRSYAVPSGDGDMWTPVLETAQGAIRRNKRSRHVLPECLQWFQANQARLGDKAQHLFLFRPDEVLVKEGKDNWRHGFPKARPFLVWVAHPYALDNQYFEQIKTRLMDALRHQAHIPQPVMKRQHNRYNPNFLQHYGIVNEFLPHGNYFELNLEHQSFNASEDHASLLTLSEMAQRLLNIPGFRPTIPQDIASHPTYTWWVKQNKMTRILYTLHLKELMGKDYNPLMPESVLIEFKPHPKTPPVSEVGQHVITPDEYALFDTLTHMVTEKTGLSPTGTITDSMYLMADASKPNASLLVVQAYGEQLDEVTRLFKESDFKFLPPKNPDAPQLEALHAALTDKPDAPKSRSPHYILDVSALPDSKLKQIGIIFDTIVDY